MTAELLFVAMGTLLLGALIGWLIGGRSAATVRAELAAVQDSNDVLQSAQTLKHAFRTDVSAILAMARVRSGGAADPVACYRAAGYRAKAAVARPAASSRS